MKVTKEYKFEAAHRLMHHEGACKNLHGHSYRIEVDVEDEPDKGAKTHGEGMVLDFGILKEVLVGVIDVGAGEYHPFDHAVILNQEDPLFKHLLKDNWREAAGIDRIIIMEGEPTAENMSRLLFRLIQKRLSALDETLHLIEVRLWETVTSYATCRRQDV